MTIDRVVALGARDDLREMAQLYETIASLDLTPEPGGAHGVPGSRVPPGMQEILDADEVTGGLREVDEWAAFLVHVLTDERDTSDPGLTPARLRMVGEHAQHFLDHDDELLALAFRDESRDHLKALRKLAQRGMRHVRTGMQCQDPTCVGHYGAVVGGTAEGAICCDKCKHRVEYQVWSSWPRTGHYVTVKHAASIAGTTVEAIKKRASRGKWRRMGEGRDVRYHSDDVLAVDRQTRKA